MIDLLRKIVPIKTKFKVEFHTTHILVLSASELSCLSVEETGSNDAKILLCFESGGGQWQSPGNNENIFLLLELCPCPHPPHYY